MFLNAVVLVLQETLEAALLMSILLVLLHQTGEDAPGIRWVFTALLTGLTGAWLYAEATPTISTWFDYVGLEICNALIQAGIIICVLLLCYNKKPTLKNSWILTLMATLVALSIVREGSEIFLYMEGILGQPENVSTVLMGGLTGAGLGISSGIVLYYSLMMFRQKTSQRLAMVLLAFFAGNMAAQAVLLLNQADWLPYTPQLWDTSGLLPEFSVAGQLLYALVGYEANPSLLQALGYTLAWCLVIISPLLRRGWQPASDTNE